MKKGWNRPQEMNGRNGRNRSKKHNGAGIKMSSKFVKPGDLDPSSSLSKTNAKVGGTSGSRPKEQQPVQEQQQTYEKEEKIDESLDFRARFNAPLSSLMDEFGEQDLDWRKVEPVEKEETSQNNSTGIHNANATKEDTLPSDIQETTTNRLTTKEKAPIHVEFTSFGYVHGVPSELSQGVGWSHARPLAPLECRDLPPVPGYLEWRDGTAFAVQRSFFDTDARAMARQLAEQVFAALEEAINEGGHGYASPLQMKVYLGSEKGRHRSVVVCESAAKGLRNLLRKNRNNKITVSISVGTFHRELQRQKMNQKQQAKPSKQWNSAYDDEIW